MGMSVCGRAPKGPAGEYFCVPCWTWSALLRLISEAKVVYGLEFNMASWRFNDGDGLRRRADCLALAKALESIISWHPQQVYIEQSGSTVLFEDETPMAGRDVETPCWPDRETVAAFVEFLRLCGPGFEIW
jgi:hypothetical protein